MEQGWDRLSDGELLNKAERFGFEVLLTADKNKRVSAEPHRRTEHSSLAGFGTVFEKIALAVSAATPGSYSVVQIPFKK